MLALLAPLALAARDCAGTTATDAGGAPLVPIDQLAGPYTDAGGHDLGWGLYGGGVDTRPDAHTSAGLLAASEARTARHADGAPCAGALTDRGNEDCAVVLLSLSMSNGTHEWSGRGPDAVDPALGFVAKASADPERLAHLVVVDGALGGMQAQCMSGQACADPAEFDRYWDEHVAGQLERAGVTAAQVTALWVKPANHDEANPDHAAWLESNTLGILGIASERFPNVAMAFLNARTYGGYIGGPGGNVEPIAYEQGLVLAGVVARQIAADPELAGLPWLDWGIYLWANGTTPGSTGITWACDDFREDDGQHPSAEGVDKVSDLLLEHFHGDPVAAAYYLAEPPTSVPGTPSGGDTGAGGGAALDEVADRGCGCAASGRVRAALTLSAPVLLACFRTGRRRQA